MQIKRPVTNPRIVSSMLAIAVASAAASVAHAVEQYTISQAGLYDASSSPGGHMGNNSLTNNSFTFFNALGEATGQATRYTSSTTTSTVGVNDWFYNPTTQTTSVIGLVAPYSATAASNTESDGVESSSVRFLNNSGVATGTSAFYSSAVGTGGATNLGNEVWIYTPSTGTTEIGYFDSQPSGTVGHINTSNGKFSNSVVALNTAGQVVGTSSRYDGSFSEGVDSWIYSNGQTINIGLTGGIYNNTAGGDPENQVSNVNVLNNNGQAAGYASKFDGSGGSQAFVYDPTLGTTAVGLSNGTYNYYSSVINSSSKINNVIVTGSSTTSTFSGSTAFVYNLSNQTTTAVSLDLTQTPPGGNGSISYVGGTSTTFFSSISAINNAGQAIGSQSIYLSASSVSPGSSAGSDAFFFNGTITVPIGLTDAAHTANPPTSFVFHGTQYTARTNGASYLNDSGQVAGSATLFTQTTTNGTVSSSSIGANAWVYTAAAGTNIIGMTSSLYTNSTNGGQNSTVNSQNASGLIVGTSTRYYSNGTSAGSDAYLYTPGANGTYGNNITIGLTDTGHTSSDGINKGTTSVNFLNANGLVAGTATRFGGANGTTTNGQDAWVYNANSGTTYQITLSTTSVGFASSSVQYLNDAGILLGTYNKYNSSDVLLGTFAYAFEGGQAYDLGIDTTNFTAAGWQKLASTFAADPLGDIAGTGTISNGTITYTSLYVLAAQGLLGDANLDGHVDLTDLNIVLNHLGATSSLRGDGNFDGAATIDLTDLNDVLNNLGTSLSTNAQVAAAEALVGGSATAAPEPASLSLLLVGGLLLAQRRRSRS